MAEIVAAGILHQRVVELQQFAGTGDHLQAGDPVAGIAVADHADAAGIGGDIAADRTRAARGEIHRIHQTMLARGIVHRFQRHAGLDDERAIHRIELQRLVQALQAQHQLAVGSHRTAGQAGAPARRHHRNRVRIGPAQHRLHLVHRTGQGDRQRVGRPAPRPVAAVVFQVGRLGLQTQRGHGLLQRKDAGIGHGTRRCGRNRTACQCAPGASSCTAWRRHGVGFS